MLLSVLTFVALPPANLIVLAACGLAMSWRRPAAGRTIAVAGVGGLLLLSLPAVSGSLLAALEGGWPTMPSATPAAIVILGGDVGPGRERVDIGALTLQRLRGGAALQRASGLPVLVTGGVLDQGFEPVAVLMARSLVGDFAVPVRWVEPAAADTWQNAQYSAAILKREGIGAVFVVTHAWHMRRALIAFAAAGLAATPAPLPPERAPRFVAADFVPRAGAWQRSYFALHEWFGIAWYAWRRGHGG